MSEKTYIEEYLNDAFNCYLIDGHFDTFSFNLNSLLYRVVKLMLIVKKHEITEEDKYEKYTFLDATIISVRSMFLENYKNTHTMQNVLQMQGKESEMNKINKYLESPFLPYDAEEYSVTEKDGSGYPVNSIKNCIKFISDKYVAHNEFIQWEQRGFAQDIMSTMTNPQSDKSIYAIISDLLRLAGYSTLFPEVPSILDNKANSFL